LHAGRKEKIEWECDNGGQLYWESAAANISSSPAFPAEFCIVGFPTINTAFIVGLLVDLGFQVCPRLVWRSGF
jgi:hypothetical protein